MRALLLTVKEFDDAVKPGGLLHTAISQGLDPEIVVDHQNRKIVVALDTAMEKLLASRFAPKASA